MKPHLQGRSAWFIRIIVNSMLRARGVLFQKFWIAFIPRTEVMPLAHICFALNGISIPQSQLDQFSVFVHWLIVILDHAVRCCKSVLRRDCKIHSPRNYDQRSAAKQSRYGRCRVKAKHQIPLKQNATDQPAATVDHPLQNARLRLSVASDCSPLRDLPNRIENQFGSGAVNATQV